MANLHDSNEPGAWMDGYRNLYSLEEKAAGCEDAAIPLYTAPQPREWRGLTDVERIDLGVISEAVSAQSLIGMVEAKLKEKNT